MFCVSRFVDSDSFVLTAYFIWFKHLSWFRVESFEFIWKTASGRCWLWNSRRLVDDVSMMDSLSSTPHSLMTQCELFAVSVVESVLGFIYEWHCFTPHAIFITEAFVFKCIMHEAVRAPSGTTWGDVLLHAFTKKPHSNVLNRILPTFHPETEREKVI